MSNYLQRLLDRSTPTTPVSLGVQSTVQPTGQSHSPISLSDQRLNDPGFADSFVGGFADSFTDQHVEPTYGNERSSKSATEPTAHAPRKRPPMYSGIPLESKTHARPGSMVDRIDSVESATPITDREKRQEVGTSGEVPITETNKPPQSLIRPVGYIDDSDLVLPESESATTNDALPTPPRPQEATKAQLLSDVVEERSVITQNIKEVKNTPLEPKQIKPQQAHTDSTLLAVKSETLTTVEEATRPTQSEIHPVVEAVPPLAVAPAVPDSPRPAPHQPQTPPKPQAVQEVQNPPAQAESSKKKPSRPMTAAEASIIGPFTPRRRALTIFGLRRR